MRTPTTTSLRLASGALIAAFLLSGCSAADPSGQSSDDACGTLKSQLSSINQRLGESMSKLQDDPTSAAQAVAKVSSELAAATDGVTNTQIKPLADKAVDDLSAFSDAVGQAVKDMENEEARNAVVDSASTANESLVAVGQACK